MSSHFDDKSEEEPKAWAFTVVPQTAEGRSEADPFDTVDFDHPSETGYGRSDGFQIRDVQPLYADSDRSGGGGDD